MSVLKKQKEMRVLRNDLLVNSVSKCRAESGMYPVVNTENRSIRQQTEALR